MAILMISDSVQATKYMTLADFTYGVAGFMVCCQALIFSILGLWTLSAIPKANRSSRTSDYTKLSGSEHTKDASAARYIWEWILPKELFVGTWEGLKFLVCLPCGRKRFDYTGGGISMKEMRRRTNAPYQSVDESAPMYHTGYAAAEDRARLA